MHFRDPTFQNLVWCAEFSIHSSCAYTFKISRYAPVIITIIVIILTSFPSVVGVKESAEDASQEELQGYKEPENEAERLEENKGTEPEKQLEEEGAKGEEPSSNAELEDNNEKGEDTKQDVDDSEEGKKDVELNEDESIKEQ